MAIQHRRGIYDRFDPTRLLPGEWAIVLSGDASARDGMAAYICFAAGKVKRIATFEDMVENIANADAEIVAQLTEQTRLVEQAIEEAETLRVLAESGRASAEDARVAAEASRALAERGRADAEASRVRAESGRARAESDRERAEAARESAEAGRADAEQGREQAEAARAEAESSRASAEAARAEAESKRESGEITRVVNENARKSAETKRANAESARESAESERATAEAARAASFAEMEQRSKGWLRYYCQEGEYDQDTRKPTVADPDTATLYYVPVSSPTADNEWVEWMWDTSDGGRWEALGTTEATIDPVTAAQVDSIAAGESVTGSQVVNATGLTYIWAKLKAAFAAVAHTHDASDLASGTLADARLPTKGSAGTAGTSSATSGHTLAVPYVTTDAYGRVTGKGTHTHTSPRGWYATCSTEAGTAAKAAACSNFALLAGALILVRFAYANTAASPTLNVNSTGARAIYGNASTAAESATWAAGETVLLVYDGSYWRMLSSFGNFGTLPVAQGGTGAATAAGARASLGVNAANVVDGYAISPSSVTATGTVKAATVEDSGGTLAALRESVSQKQTFKTTDFISFNDGWSVTSQVSDNFTFKGNVVRLNVQFKAANAMTALKEYEIGTVTAELTKRMFQYQAVACREGTFCLADGNVYYRPVQNQAAGSVIWVRGAMAAF